MPDPIPPPPPPELSPEENERQKKLSTAWACLIFLHLLLAVIALCIFIEFAAKGMRNLVPESAEKMSKTPFIGRLFRGESTANTDKAFVACTVVYFVVFALLKEMLCIVHLGMDATDKHRRLVSIAAPVLILGDALLMYAGIASLSWGNLRFSFAALLFSVVYVVVTLWLALVCAKLKVKIANLEAS